METMPGLRLPGGGEVVLDEFPVPEPGPEEVLIEIRASGLCGSDLHAYRRLRTAEPDERARFVSGHEPAGVIAQVGERVSHFRAGDRVFAYHISGCGYCHQCRRGYMVNCTSPLRSAYGEHRNGGNARFMMATERTLLLLPEPLTFSDGAMLACTAGTAFGACVRANVSAKDDVFIAGMGPVGLTVAVTAQAYGARVSVADVNTDRLKLAESLGIQHALPVTDDALDRLLELTDGEGPSVTIDCSGNDAARALCLQAAGTWGRTVFIGYGGRSLQFDAGALVLRKQLTLMGSSVCSIGQMEDAAAFFAGRALHPSKIVQGEFSLREASQVFANFAGGAPGKYIFDPAQELS
ncbi:MAG TPA: alcohol dehydrogenase catalytic domain-containing protein [Acidimicrobiales bacterium]|nr:alcohol dehydrogenase catalytic domain-containing protein [Acidimicrobiales bacterium]